MKQTKIVVVGSFVQDLAFSTETFPGPGETRIGEFRTGPGGKGFNQAVAAHRQAVETTFIGACGKDLFAAAIKDFIAHEGLQALLQEFPGEPTGTAGILVDRSGQNSIVVALGANNYLTPEFISSHAEIFKESLVTLVQAECNLAASVRALETGRANGTVTILNPAPINDLVTRETLALADILTPNETEFQFLLRALFDQELPKDLLSIPREDLHAAAKKLGAATVVITLGKEGAFVSHNPAVEPTGRVPYRQGEQEPHYLIPAIAADAIDTTGAGDAFSGGLAAGIVFHPESFRRAVEHATVVAALSTERVGTAPSMPKRDEVESRIRAQSR